MNLEGVFSANWMDVPAKEIFPGIRKRVLWQGLNGAEAQIVLKKEEFRRFQYRSRST